MPHVRVAVGEITCLVSPVLQSEIQLAQEMRARRDELYSNRYPVLDTDLRWGGELAEIHFRAWLLAENVENEWLDGDKGSRLHDFLVAGWRLGIKSVKRQGPMEPHYTAQITEEHVHEPVDAFFFCNYEVPV